MYPAIHHLRVPLEATRLLAVIAGGPAGYSRGRADRAADGKGARGRAAGGFASEWERVLGRWVVGYSGVATEVVDSTPDASAAAEPAEATVGVAGARPWRGPRRISVPQRIAPNRKIPATHQNATMSPCTTAVAGTEPTTAAELCGARWLAR